MSFVYTKKELESLKIKFKNSDRIEKNYSQVLQDIFVLSCLDGGEEEFFLEIGCSHPTDLSNTYLLESKFGWNGISIDNIEVEDFSKIRKSEYLICDALSIDYSKLLKEKKTPKVMGYLSLDIEPGYNSLTCLEKLPLDEYKFKVITFEHDYYSFPPARGEEIRKKQRDILIKNGYVMAAKNISNLGNGETLNAFEDWWVHPDYIDPLILEKIINPIDNNKLPLEIIYI